MGSIPAATVAAMAVVTVADTAAAAAAAAYLVWFLEVMLLLWVKKALAEKGLVVVAAARADLTGLEAAAAGLIRVSCIYMPMKSMFLLVGMLIH